MAADKPSPDSEGVRQTGRVATFTGVMLFWAAAFVPVYLALGGIQCSIVLVSGCLFALAILYAIRAGVSTSLCGHMLCGAAFYVYTVLAILCGGRWAPTTIWYVSMPVLSLAVGGTSAACIWSAAGLMAIVVFSVLDYSGVVIPSELAPPQLILLHSLGLAALLLCFFVLAYVMMRFERRAREVLRDANQWLQLASTSDSLTNVANRRCFDEVFEREWNRHLREQLPLTLALIDLDYFKDFNDIYGHLAGDNVLRQIAAAIQNGIRRNDMVARFGGEEFVVILPNTGEQTAPEITANIRNEIDRLGIEHPRSNVSRKVTISIGATTIVPCEVRSHNDLLRRADEALYLAKAAGRDRVIHVPSTPSTEGVDCKPEPIHVPIAGPREAHSIFLNLPTSPEGGVPRDDVCT